MMKFIQIQIDCASILYLFVCFPLEKVWLDFSALRMHVITNQSLT